MAHVPDGSWRGDPQAKGEQEDRIYVAPAEREAELLRVLRIARNALLMAQGAYEALDVAGLGRSLPGLAHCRAHNDVAIAAVTKAVS